MGSSQRLALPTPNRLSPPPPQTLQSPVSTGARVKSMALRSNDQRSSPVPGYDMTTTTTTTPASTADTMPLAPVPRRVRFLIDGQVIVPGERILPVTEHPWHWPHNGPGSGKTFKPVPKLSNSPPRPHPLETQISTSSIANSSKAVTKLLSPQEGKSQGRALGTQGKMR